jgi:asparagine synthase (glutamine-hydrolysing)
VITWDGRLDNRGELIDQMPSELVRECSDLEIVAAAYEHWGTSALAKLIGDWALSVWNPTDRTLILAKDFIGARRLYYSVEKDQVVWCTLLDPLLTLAGHAFKLEEEYVAGWLALFPAAHLTPYVGIHSVRPSSFVRLRQGTESVVKYWDFDPGKQILYRSDAEYEEHFRAIFAQSVRRRLRSHRPILAELSGGLDSSSIVCMADVLLARGHAEAPRVDTVSYYDDSEPTWNERPYFSRVEEKRGRKGCHIDISLRGPLTQELERNRFEATPSNNRASEFRRAFSNCVQSQSNRVVLSGFGGDEVTGGVPTPIPELEDYVARAQIGRFVRQLTRWAIEKRKPWFQLCLEAVRGFFPAPLFGLLSNTQTVRWLSRNFLRKHRAALRGYDGRLRLFAPLPSFQENMFTLEALRGQVECIAQPSEPPYDKAFPFLDRSLLDFLYKIPREQLIRPGQRRSLLRRALTGVVPETVLQRKRKAFAARGPLAAISADWANLSEINAHLVTSHLGIVDAGAFAGVMQKARQGIEVPMVTLLRTLNIEFWLRSMIERNVIDGTSNRESHDKSLCPAKIGLGPMQPRSAS